MPYIDAKVAVLLATYNGSKYVREQVRSLSENHTQFQVHWVDDHSTDDTRDIVRDAAKEFGVDFIERHQPQRLDVPIVYFLLMEDVAADVYLFCDQDDIWQRGKIDAAVADLLPHIHEPVLSYSEPLMFFDNRPDELFPTWEVMLMTNPKAFESSRAFTVLPAIGNAIGFTRALREIFLRHKKIALEYAYMHDFWMYLIANACGVPRVLSNVPTTLWRRHDKQFSAPFVHKGSKGRPHITLTPHAYQLRRRRYARQARGFVLAADTLVPGPRLQRQLKIARLVSTLDQQQSPIGLLRLALEHALSPNSQVALGMAVACIRSDATA